ncbi:NAD-dependent epimerase/dehydratase family protein [Actinomyces sp. 2119]|uniref:NAD-dependent epimerase/dehydratase family protein n=1 Tax=Actinomyces lilanjuaniae TaxID=2321394 RepID=A0ABM6Z5N1_9ACTO|nr:MULTISPECIES: NAD(P)H-binding protein [Actinomyces]AYD90651.1 NAD-dependent epimerase/dehydratase family protein [Actinomyces lilanjuaniae]RJF43884.1 NAD-dependent epimerase/dehydratase family protein [Actinomyces sp. 2119]
MKIAVIGGTGMVGSRTVTEAASRGHEVTSATRSGRPAADATTDIVTRLSDVEAVRRLLADNDVVIITTSPDRTGGPVQPTIDEHRALVESLTAEPLGRLVVVGGAGALETEPGSGQLIKDTPDFPAEVYPEANAYAQVLELYRGAGSAFAWSVVAPAPTIEPGQRTGTYTQATDSPAGPRVSAEDMAVALVDEAESDAHRGIRWTVASQG